MGIAAVAIRKRTMEFSLLLGVFIFICCTPLICIVETVQFPLNPTPEVTHDDRNTEHKRETETKIEADSDDPDQEKDKFNEESKDQLYLEEALKNVLDPSTVIINEAEVLKQFQMKILELEGENNITLDSFMNEMDNLSLNVCVKSQEARWSYLNDAGNEGKKNYMVNIVNEEDEIKRKYWQMLEGRYKNEVDNAIDPRLKIRIHRIHKIANDVKVSKIEDRAEINEMQRIWTLATVCPYNISSCTAQDRNLTIRDLESIFITSNDTDELAYYWKSYRDATGKKIRPLFKKYVIKVNQLAKAGGFYGMNEMWFYVFEDDNLGNSVAALWNDLKPLYSVLHEYVATKLKIYYKDLYKSDIKNIPAHLLGNMWAQDWRAIYSKVVPYPDHHLPRLIINTTEKQKYFFDLADEFHQSLGFESAKESYGDIDELPIDSNCHPSSHDMCDGINYRIRWCSEQPLDTIGAISRAAKLLGNIQYFKHYRNLPVIFRDAPNAAFREALSDIFALQLINPQYLKNLNTFEVDTSPEATINYLLWVALEKLPLMGYAFVLDQWRWETFKSDNEKWNQFWWELREGVTGITAPVPRNESDLDPASKYHVVSHTPYTMYLTSQVFEIQILLSLCRLANYTGPLHECSIFGNKEAGLRLSKAMSLGASKELQTVFKVITNETQLSAAAFLEYFSPLENFLKNETIRLNALRQDEMDKSAPIIVGVIIVSLTVMIIILYCVKKHNLENRISSFCSFRRNELNERETNIQMQGKTSDTDAATTNEPKI